MLKAVFTFLVKRCALGHGEGLRVNGYSKVTRTTVLGDNVNFNGMSITGAGKVMIGNNFHSGKNCTILTSYHNYHGKSIPYDATLISKDVVIEDNVWIGMGVIILAGVTIGEGVIVQAGSVVVKSIPRLSIAGGHPAVVFSTRDKEHYELHKNAKNFF